MAEMLNSREISQGYKYFLVGMEFRSGKYGQPFYHIVKARNDDEAIELAAKYLENYYGDDNFDGRIHDFFSYFDGEVSVSLKSCEEVKQLIDIISRL